MEKIFYNNDGPIYFMSAGQETLDAYALQFAFYEDPPEYITIETVNNYHAEAGIVVPGPYLITSPQLPPTYVSSFGWEATGDGKVGYSADTTVQALPPYYPPISIDTLQTALTGCRVDTRPREKENSVVNLAASISVWNTAVNTYFLLIPSVVRSYGCDIVLHGPFLYFCIKDHVATVDNAPGTTAGSLLWCAFSGTYEEGVADWAATTTYSQGTKELLDPYTFGNVVSTAPPLVFSTMNLAVKDESPEHLEAVFYGILLVCAGANGGGTTAEGFLSLYGSDFLKAVQNCNGTVTYY